MKRNILTPLIFLICFGGCTLNGEDAIKEPSVTTQPVTEITATSAKGAGAVTNDGGSAVTERGIVWSESSSPTVSDQKAASGSGVGAFEAAITNLAPGKKYFVRAYATNSSGTGYGDQVDFTTRADLVSITITTAMESIPKGFTVEFTAQGKYADNTTDDLTDDVTWTSVNADVLSNLDTDADNIFKGTGEGTTSVIAALGDVSADYELTVTPKVLQLLTIDVQETDMMPGTTQEIKVNGKFSDESIDDVTSEITWTSTDEDVAIVEVDEEGAVISAKDFGTTELGAVLGAAVTTVNINVKVILGKEYAGGIVFYIDETGQHGLVAAKEDQSEGIIWWVGTWVYSDDPGTTPDEAVGTGAANTATIVSVQGDGTYAAKLCADLELEGHDDWFLPSIDELVLICQNLYSNNIGGLDDGFYWSSSDVSARHNASWIQFSDHCGIRTDLGRNMENRVRAVRAF